MEKIIDRNFNVCNNINNIYMIIILILNKAGMQK